MKTDLHLKLESMCLIQRRKGADNHWTLTGSKTIWIPDVRAVVNTKRAIFAAFRHDIPDGHEVCTVCDHKFCVRPEHQELVEKSQSASKALDLSRHAQALGDSKSYRPRVEVNVLPADVNVVLINRVKTMHSMGNTMEKIKMATGAPYDQIMRICNGVYDEAVKNSRRKAHAKILSRFPQPAGVARKEEATPVRGEMTDEEKNWLALQNRS